MDPKYWNEYVNGGNIGDVSVRGETIEPLLDNTLCMSISDVKPTEVVKEVKDNVRREEENVEW